MKKRYFMICLIFISAMLLLSVSASAAEGGRCGEVSWQYEDGTLYIYGNGAMEDYASVLDRPWIHLSDEVYTIWIEDGVTSVGENSFFNFSNLSTIVLPDSLTKIGMAAFSSCENLTWIFDSELEQRIPDSVQIIDLGAFAFCSSLTNLDLGNSVEYIGPSAFTDCTGLLQVILSPATYYIDNYAFYKCFNLSEITFPDEVAHIGSKAFYGCYGIQNIRFEGDAPEIAEDAFGTDSTLIVAKATYPHGNNTWTIYKFQNYGGDIVWYSVRMDYIAEGSCGINVFWQLDRNGKLEIYGSGSMFNYDTINFPPWYSWKNRITSVVISDGVTHIGNTAFYKCTEIEEFSIPDSVTSFGNDAFFDCDNITNMEIGPNVTQIGETAFLSCDSLLYFRVDPSNPSFANDDQGCLYNKDMTLLICVPPTFSGHLEIPYGVEEIAMMAAYSCTEITSVTFPDTLRIIGNSSFICCSKLESVEIPASVELVDHAAFWYCNNITEIHFYGDAPTFIGDTIFVMVSAPVYYPADNHTWTVAVRQNYSGNLTWVPYSNPKFDIDVARMILGNSLEFQFGVSQTKLPDKTGYYATIEKQWSDGSTTVLTIPASEWGTAGTYWAIAYDGLAAKEMADNFYVTIYNADGTAVSNSRTDSVRSYVSRAFANQSATGKTMMVDMLNYGAAAQNYFNYNTGDLANSQLSEAQKACGTSNAPTVQNNRVIGPKYSGTRLVLESRIQMQMAFADMNRTMYAVYTYTDHNGKKQSVTVNGSDFVQNGNMYGIELSKLVYADARQVVSVKVYNADGTLHGSAKDGIESYVKRSGATEPLFDALIKFTDSAKAYLH